MYIRKIMSDKRGIKRRLLHKLRNLFVSDKKIKYMVGNKPTMYDWLCPFTGTLEDLVNTIMPSIMMPLFFVLFYGFIFSFQSEEEQLSAIMICMFLFGNFFFGRYFYGCYKKKKWMDSLDHYPLTMDDLVIPAEVYTLKEPKTTVSPNEKNGFTHNSHVRRIRFPVRRSSYHRKDFSTVKR